MHVQQYISLSPEIGRTGRADLGFGKGGGDFEISQHSSSATPSASPTYFKVLHDWISPPFPKFCCWGRMSEGRVKPLSLRGGVWGGLPKKFFEIWVLSCNLGIPQASYGQWEEKNGVDRSYATKMC